MVFTEAADGFTRKDSAPSFSLFDWMGGAYVQLWINGRAQLDGGDDVASPCCVGNIFSDCFVWDNASVICPGPTLVGLDFHITEAKNNLQTSV